jgi:dTMP kinase
LVTPRFITFEGIDGSGKSTHLRAVGAWLGEHRVMAELTHEPGGTPLGDAVRALFLDRRLAAMDGVTELLLVFASRRQHLLERIEPSLAAGRHVLCDRFTDSTRAYQGYGRGVPLPLIEELDRVATGGRRPDRTLLFDLPAAEARRRRHSGPAGDQGGDRMDHETLAFYERVRDGYLALAAREPSRFRVIDSRGDSEATASQVREALADLLAERRAESA